ncbi:phage integrase family protein : Phage-related integrase OS=Rhodopirellula baltica SWK14 GN=RBSWK_01414 PE=4 SV=1: Phage_integrase [Gemmataceae bacterium]|nr:phage integrase family protein : Phage-related integrase OS=Rhodopirellula baltica SWK14 GN=RBSWK_01414 PE=4 SV=1: Phage_integrase [Gemmataceae bacterium]VTT98958.1 phage integrase family protein : Phage-related integrase OS=Rhodopirellula baltica SWK14 GN=RBSWK_01414 PE=4 SV=1: Phage_integrase [Gemmataceae bacterium]
MPKRPGPWFRKSRMSWFATVQEKQYQLPVRDESDRAAAAAAYQQLLADLAAALRSQPPQPPPPPDLARAVEPARPLPTVAAAAGQFLDRRRARLAAPSFRQYDIALRVHLVPAFGPRPVASLAAEEIEEWADRPEWSNSTRHNRIGTVMTFLKWAGHPLKIARPPMESRGADAVLTDEAFARVLAAARAGGYGSDLEALLVTLRGTGARPSEVAGLTVASVDWANRLARLREHKSRRHGHGDRVIHFSSPVMEVLTGQRARHGSGHLFRTSRGNPWRPAALVKRMVQVSAKAGVHATAYMGRHTFATAALVAGVPDAVVAELLGHKGTAMVSRHYGHVGGQSRVLKDAVERLGRPKAG